MFDFFTSLLRPIEIAVAWIMVAFHTVLTAVGLPADSGLTWALSIVGLVVVIRIILIPLFVKQIKASRGMQLLQPEMKKIQAKYKGKTDTASRQAQQAEMMELYRSTGTNPFSSCLPLLAQSPIFFALFRVLNGIGQRKSIGPLSASLVDQAHDASLFGARLSDKFIGANSLSTQILTVVLIILMSLTTFTTQRQLMMKNMPASAMDNPFAQQQKMLMYVLPLVFAVSGVNFPIGVLIYWLTTNLWSMGQQFYVIHRMPAPGSPAERAREERLARKGGGGGLMARLTGGPTAQDPVAEEEVQAPAGGQRQQPRRQPRSKRGPARPGQSGFDGTEASAGGDPGTAVDAEALGDREARPVDGDAPAGPRGASGAEKASGADGTAERPAPSNGGATPRSPQRPGQRAGGGRPGQRKPTKRR